MIDEVKIHDINIKESALRIELTNEQLEQLAKYVAEYLKMQLAQEVI